ncbi:hypothetical protein RRG08_066296 [Elysia crispata]|uniref:Uncharacterized protein n=1 Tax=Elysia crispata TaxID=231223 RepID=A0AAE1AN25_9GAST|nr:hypothetical protein RRG08_066296 [Elysia crispata]
MRSICEPLPYGFNIHGQEWPQQVRTNQVITAEHLIAPGWLGEARQLQTLISRRTFWLPVEVRIELPPASRACKLEQHVQADR